jgi:UDP-2,3-diacylglucosamine pyrophosphatase LpxH
MNYVIISDLHIGADTSLDIFHSHGELASFLNTLGKSPTKLIINGDFIDFLAVPPFDQFNRTVAQEKIREIINASSNQILWLAFQSFLQANEQNRIDVLLGNHDVELVFEEVQVALRNVMVADETQQKHDLIWFCKDRLSHPQDKMGGVPIHIEHGFQYDPFNWYDREKLVLSASYGKDGSTFELPIGSRLVYRTLNKLTPHHPFIPILKPEPAVFWLLAALSLRAVKEFLKPLPAITIDTLITKTRKWRRGAQLKLQTVPASDVELIQELQLQLTEMLRDENVSELDFKDIQEYLKYGTGAEPLSIDDKLAFNPLMKGRLLLLRLTLKWLKKERDSFFNPKTADSFKDGLQNILSHGAKVAILGHSHSNKMHEIEDPDDPSRKLLYLNTGTWADLLNYDPVILTDNDKLQEWFDALKKKQFTPTPSYTFACIEELEGGRGARISLERWSNGQAEIIDSQEISGV